MRKFYFLYIFLALSFSMNCCTTNKRDMKNRNKMFIEIINKASAISTERRAKLHHGGEDNLNEVQLTALINSLDEIKISVERNEIESSKGGQVALSPIKAVIDWGEPAGSQLRKALYEIDLFYSENY